MANQKDSNGLLIEESYSPHSDHSFLLSHGRFGTTRLKVTPRHAPEKSLTKTFLRACAARKFVDDAKYLSSAHLHILMRGKENVIRGAAASVFLASFFVGDALADRIQFDILGFLIPLVSLPIAAWGVQWALKKDINNILNEIVNARSANADAFLHDLQEKKWYRFENDYLTAIQMIAVAQRQGDLLPTEEDLRSFSDKICEEEGVEPIEIKIKNIPGEVCAFYSTSSQEIYIEPNFADTNVLLHELAHYIDHCQALDMAAKKGRVVGVDGHGPLFAETAIRLYSKYGHIDFDGMFNDAAQSGVLGPQSHVEKLREKYQVSSREARLVASLTIPAR
tara:strand:+ start:78 stop:1085 length:1008 start_codon:yes stop_codon:yes gene_type:complete